MTRKDFEAIAATLASVRPDRAMYATESIRTFVAAQYAQWVETVRAMAAMCAAHNPRFAADRFLAACGLEAQ